MKIRELACAATALSLLSACTSMATSTVPSTGDLAKAQTSTHRDRAKLEVRLKIPRRHHRARYVSPSTQSITIAEGTTALGTFNTTAASGNCSAVNGGTICSFTMGILTGANQTFTVKTYDQQNALGHMLSSGSVTKNVVAGLNVIPITLDGIVSSIAIALVNPASPAGTASATRVTVMANDADGNTIVGPGAYTSPIALTNSDTSGATTLSTTTVNGPNETVTLSYTGANLTAATIGASSSGVASSSVTPGTFTPTPVGISAFQLPMGIGSNTTNAPEADAITKGGDGNLWFSAHTISGTPANEIVKMTTSGTMTEFVPGTAPSTNLPDDQFNGLTLGSDNTVWYAATSNVGSIAPSGAVRNIALSSVPGICSGPTGTRITPAGDGGLWVTVGCTTGSQLLHLTTGGNAKANNLPANDIAPQGIIVGHDTHVYIAGFDNGTKTPAVFQVTVSGDTVTAIPVVLDFSTASMGTAQLYGIAQSADGDLWVTNDDCAPSSFGRIHLAAGFAPANETVFNTLAGCASPANLATLPDDSLWIGDSGYAEALQVIPTPAQGTPTLFALSMPVPQNLWGSMWDVAVGPDGDLYFTNFHSDTSSSAPGNVVKVVY